MTDEKDRGLLATLGSRPYGREGPAPLDSSSHQPSRPKELTEVTEVAEDEEPSSAPSKIPPRPMLPEWPLLDVDRRPSSLAVAFLREELEAVTGLADDLWRASDEDEVILSPSPQRRTTTSMVPMPSLSSSSTIGCPSAASSK